MPRDEEGDLVLLDRGDEDAVSVEDIQVARGAEIRHNIHKASLGRNLRKEDTPIDKTTIEKDESRSIVWDDERPGDHRLNQSVRRRKKSHPPRNIVLEICSHSTTTILQTMIP